MRWRAKMLAYMQPTHQGAAIHRCVGIGTSRVVTRIAVLFCGKPSTKDALDMLGGDKIPFKMKIWNLRRQHQHE